MKLELNLMATLLAISLACYAQPVPDLIMDIYPGEPHGDPGRFAHVGDKIFFFATDGVNGIELWQTDGTNGGTAMVKNIGAGMIPECTSTFGCGDELIVMNNILYFRATDPVHGAELWRSDGTEAGTFMVKDINPGPGDCSNSVFMNAQYFTELNDVLYFAADGGGNNIELWRSDGTEAGTYLLKDLATGMSSVPKIITTIDDAIYFQCKNTLDQSEFWKSDGTEAGTILLKQMWLRSYDEGVHFIKYGDYIYFSGDGDDAAFNFELWRTDGTPAGTELFLELNPETSDGSDPREFRILNGKLLFSARPDVDDVIMVSDGTTGGTVQLMDKNGDAFEADYFQLQSENKLFFNGNNANDDYGLWVTDATDAGTFFLKGIESGSFHNSSATVVNGNNIVYGSYDNANGCTTVFQSNGTVAGTFRMLDCETLTTPQQMITYNGDVLLNAATEDTGRELWKLTPEFEVGINDISENDNMHVFPNPASGTITINSNEAGIITITNTMGIIMKEIITPSGIGQIDISKLPAGIYYISLNNSTSKIIKY